MPKAKPEKVCSPPGASPTKTKTVPRPGAGARGATVVKGNTGKGVTGK